LGKTIAETPSRSHIDARPHAWTTFNLFKFFALTSASGWGRVVMPSILWVSSHGTRAPQRKTAQEALVQSLADELRDKVGEHHPRQSH
jgi:hypothetical protein